MTSLFRHDLNVVSSAFDEKAVTTIRNIEVNYRGVLQRTLARRICRNIVYAAKKDDKTSFSYGRYSDAPERDGVPCKYFAVVADSSEEDLEAEVGTKVEPDSVDVSVVLDDTMVKGVEPWAWHGVRPINEKAKPDSTLLVVSNHTPEELLKFLGRKPYPYKLAILPGKSIFSGLWVFKNDGTDLRVLGAVARVDPSLVSLASLTKLITEREWEKNVEALKEGYESVILRDVMPNEGINWPYAAVVLPKWSEFPEGIMVSGMKRGGRSENFKRFTTRTIRPVIRFDTCVKCSRCWYACQDECFDPTSDGFYDVSYEYCVGCGRCAEVCPVKNTIVMVDELHFENNDSPYEQYKADSDSYIKWTKEKKGESSQKEE